MLGDYQFQVAFARGSLLHITAIGYGDSRLMTNANGLHSAAAMLQVYMQAYGRQHE